MQQSVLLQSPCSVSAAVSALIKSIRLRRVNDAVYWYLHSTRLFPDQEYRVHRRLLIASAEDGLDVPVQTAVYDWFKKTGGRNKEQVVTGAVYCIHLVCGRPNWWVVPAGFDYISRWWLAEKSERDHPEPQGKSAMEHLELLRRAIRKGDAEQAFVEHLRARAAPGYNITVHCQMLMEEAIRQNNLPARMLVQIPMVMKAKMSWDDNHLGQVLYRLVVGPLSEDRFPSISPNAVNESVQLAEHRLMKPEDAPSWAKDGMHSAGTDRRFAGVLTQMLGCCRAYQKYGRLDPADKWDGSFYGRPNLANK